MVFNHAYQTVAACWFSPIQVAVFTGEALICYVFGLVPLDRIQKVDVPLVDGPNFVRDMMKVWTKFFVKTGSTSIGQMTTRQN